MLGMYRNNTTNDIVSAMVRLNEKGLSVPFKIEDLKMLPKIPNTGARVKKHVIADHLPMTAQLKQATMQQFEMENKF